MTDRIKDKWKYYLPLILVIIVYYGAMQLLGITCPIKYVTGISCAGCGMTRAWLSLIVKGDPAMAFAYHPLFWMVPIVCVMWLFRQRFPKLAREIFFWIVVIAFLAVWIYRMAAHTGDIVVFEPQNSLPWRLICWFLEKRL